jgi:hypothetical protein
MAPRFLVHVTDNDTRVIGFLLERIANAREAGPADLEKCKDTLSRLRALGIAYGGPLKRYSFLVCDGDVAFSGAAGEKTDGSWSTVALCSSKWRHGKVTDLQDVRYECTDGP